jgi:transcriptional regulator with XRE-family HTH domain
MRGVEVNGEAIYTSRVKLGLTQEQLANAAKIDVKTLRKAEQGKRIDLEPLTRLAFALNTEIRLLTIPGESETSRENRNRELILVWTRVFDAQDMEALLALYHDNAVLRLPGAPQIPFGGTYQGKEELRKAYAQVWQVQHKSIGVDEMTILTSGNSVTLSGAKGAYLPNGELFHFPCLQIFNLENGLIMEHQVEFDTLEFVKRMQLPM